MQQGMGLYVPELARSQCIFWRQQDNRRDNYVTEDKIIAPISYDRQEMCVDSH